MESLVLAVFVEMCYTAAMICEVVYWLIGVAVIVVFVVLWALFLRRCK